MVIVTGETIVIEANMVYTVHIKLMVGEELIEKTITVTAITQSQVFHTVNFHLNGGVGTFPSQSVLSGSVANLPENEPTKEGYTFTGWYSDQDLLQFFDFGDVIIDDLDLYAGFEPVLVITSVVHFNLMGGSGTINDQIISLGGYAVLPTVIPTKTGFTFVGWYGDEEGLSEFSFDLTMIYSQTTIYAKWEEIIVAVTYTVNYDFNGAVQLESVTETVDKNDLAYGLTQNPSYPNYTLYGWALDAEGLDMWNFQTDQVTSDITLFAIWHFNYLEIDAFTYFEEPIIRDQSIINDYEIEQILEHHVVLLGNDLDDEFPNLGTLKAVGMVYSVTNTNPRYFSENAMRVEETELDLNIENWIAVNYYSNTLPLIEDATYHVVYFARFEASIVYSETSTFETANVVSTGTAIGADYVVSGGYYEIDNGTNTMRPYMMFEIINGYDATHENDNYSSYQYVYKSGYNSLITRDIATGERYLHVYHVEFAKPFINTHYIFKTSSQTGLRLSYEFTFSHLEYITYNISEAGVLLSDDKPFLQIGFPGVTKKVGTVNSLQTEYQMDTEYTYPAGHQTIYARGYVIINGIVHYSTEIDAFSYDANDQTYISTGTLIINHIETDTTNGYSIYRGAGVEFDVYETMATDYSKTTYINTAQFTHAGTFFIFNMGSTYLEEIFIVEHHPVFTGVAEGGVYQGGTVFSVDMYDSYVYYQKDGGSYVNLPKTVKLIEPGYYTLYFQGPAGGETISFTITA